MGMDNTAIVENNRLKLVELDVRLRTVEEKTAHYERLLIRGIDGNPSLPEVVRALTLTVNEFIKSRQAEEQYKKAQWDKWKWAIIGTVIPAVLLFMFQSIIFFVRIVPILLEM